MPLNAVPRMLDAASDVVTVCTGLGFIPVTAASFGRSGQLPLETPAMHSRASRQTCGAHSASALCVTTHSLAKPSVSRR
ncbi:hypothetical protein EES41_02970 [Streptomyces sp. ADI95-16]|nr:hypothetical protein EES41_02970 [Streptomyces sp. ADI95-16]